jgi:hypothetical protein
LQEALVVGHVLDDGRRKDDVIPAPHRGVEPRERLEVVVHDRVDRVDLAPEFFQGLARRILEAADAEDRRARVLLREALDRLLDERLLDVRALDLLRHHLRHELLHAPDRRCVSLPLGVVEDAVIPDRARHPPGAVELDHARDAALARRASGDQAAFSARMGSAVVRITSRSVERSIRLAGTASARCRNMPDSEIAIGRPASAESRWPRPLQLLEEMPEDPPFFLYNQAS